MSRAALALRALAAQASVESAEWEQVAKASKTLADSLRTGECQRECVIEAASLERVRPQMS